MALISGRRCRSAPGRLMLVLPTGVRVGPSASAVVPASRRPIAADIWIHPRAAFMAQPPLGKRLRARVGGLSAAGPVLAFSPEVGWQGSLSHRARPSVGRASAGREKEPRRFCSLYGTAQKSWKRAPQSQSPEGGGSRPWSKVSPISSTTASFPLFLGQAGRLLSPLQGFPMGCGPVPGACAPGSMLSPRRGWRCAAEWMCARGPFMGEVI